MSDSIAFIGGGQMAAALIGGLLKAGHPAARVTVAEPDASRAKLLHDQFGVMVKTSASETVAGAQIVVLAVKPQVMNEAVRGLKLAAGTTVISIAAGVRLASLRRWLGPTPLLVRCMPNTPALLGAGITGLYAETPSPALRAQAESVLHAAGECVWVTAEAQLDAVTALSGSGPAYYFWLTEALREAGAALGLDKATAAKLARQTFIGAARMAEHSVDDVSQLRVNVTSKGGTTEAAVNHLDTAGGRALFAQALAAANRRAAELGDTLEKT
ncbi:MAG: pyrroline-5-carboxylate reductase [Pseudomonadota bacterium]